MTIQDGRIECPVILTSNLDRVNDLRLRVAS
jgi:hypothetical protein